MLYGAAVRGAARIRSSGVRASLGLLVGASKNFLPDVRKTRGTRRTLDVGQRGWPHDTGVARCLLIWRVAEELAARLRERRRLERASGVI